jgi:sec-independent protein translocase protein TatC
LRAARVRAFLATMRGCPYNEPRMSEEAKHREPATDDARTAAAKKHGFDPEDYRMSIGDHLEELRHRLVLGMLGFLVAFVIWFVLGERAVAVFLRPLQIAFARTHLQQQVYFTEVSEPFMVYIRVSMILGVATAAPWLVYQIWQFVAAGLYPHERKYVTKYLPLSIILMISGMLFLYFYVLPLMLEFFLIFHIANPLPLKQYGEHTPPTAATQPVQVPMLNGDPKDPPAGSLWYDIEHGLLKFKLNDKDTRVIALGSGSLTSPIITLATYIDMVIEMLLSFGVAFQMPLVVLALNKIGIMDIPTLKKWRRIVYFSMSIVAAFIVPDVATGMIALLVPLILLYELGILLAIWSEKKVKREAEST